VRQPFQLLVSGVQVAVLAGAIAADVLGIGQLGSLLDWGKIVR
jgi:hypothetical protein